MGGCHLDETSSGLTMHARAGPTNLAPRPRPPSFRGHPEGLVPRWNQLKAPHRVSPRQMGPCSRIVRQRSQRGEIHKMENPPPMRLHVGSGQAQWRKISGMIRERVHPYR